MREEIHVSTDVEADGPIPGPHSMLSFASVAYDSHGNELATFAVNLKPLPDAKPHPATMAWWYKNPEAYAQTKLNARDPEDAMRDYKGWLLALGAAPVFVGYPVAYDFMFVYWYLMRFVGESPFSHSGWDVKTAASIALACPYREVGKRRMPKEWFGPTRHAHEALADAREQGELHFNIRRALGLTPEKTP
mgnify:CR=1 FL=1